MAHSGTPWRHSNLTGDIQTDGEATEHRVPQLGLHPEKFGPGMTEDQLEQCEGRVESGFCDSFLSSGLGSLNSQDILHDRLDRLTLGEHHDSTDSHKQFRQPPHTSFHMSPSHMDNRSDKTDTTVSLDEGFISGEKFISTDSALSEERLPGQCSEDSLQLQEQTQYEDIHLRKQREIESIFMQDEDGDTQLHIAIIQGMDVMALHMISLVPDPEFLNITNNLFQTPLHLATVTKQPTVIRRLAAMGAALDIRDRFGNTAMHLACRDGSLDCVKALTLPISFDEMKTMSSTGICLPQDPELKNYDGETCLHLAAANYHLPVISYLVGEEVRANINIRDGRSGRTILHYAIEANRPDLVLLLLSRGADVNARTYDGTTPLQMAAGRGFQNIVPMLLNSGADYDQLSHDHFDDSSESEEEMMEGPLYDDFQIAGQPIHTI